MTWRPAKHRFIEFCFICCTCMQKHRFCWLPSVSYRLEPDDLKNIWRQIEMMNCQLYLILRSESEIASDRKQLYKIFAALWYEGCLSWLMSWSLKSWYWTWKSQCKTAKQKSCPMRLSKASCICRSNISRLPTTGRKKVANLLCVGTVCCMGHKLLERTLDLLSAACPLIWT